VKIYDSRLARHPSGGPDLRSDLPILAQGLPAVFLEGLPAVLLESLSADRLAGLPAVFMTDLIPNPQLIVKF